MAPVSAVVWVHADCLNPNQTPLKDNAQAPALFVWDDALLARRALSLKRVVFIYECLLALPVTIRRGAVAAELIAFAREQGADEVVTVASVSPGFGRISRALEAAGLVVTAVAPPPFVSLDETPDLRRFSRYWRTARPALQAFAARR